MRSGLDELVSVALEAADVAVLAVVVAIDVGGYNAAGEIVAPAG